MWFWQRREVYMGKDGPQLYAVRTALEQAGIGFECIVRSGRNYTGADRRMTNAHSADAGIWYVYVRSADLEASGEKMDGRRKAANAGACAGAGRKGAPER